MRFTIEGPPEGGDQPRPLRRRLLWFVVLWFAGLAVTATTAYLLRAALFI